MDLEEFKNFKWFEKNLPLNSEKISFETCLETSGAPIVIRSSAGKSVSVLYIENGLMWWFYMWNDEPSVLYGGLPISSFYHFEGNHYYKLLFDEPIKISLEPLCCNQKMSYINLAHKCEICWKIV